MDRHDDSIWRYVVYHRKYLVDRHEWGDEIVAVFDNDAEYEATLYTLADEVRQRINVGLTDARQAVSGVLIPPGSDAKRQDVRARYKAIVGRQRLGRVQ